MVDINRTLGEAPAERETAGTSGRVSVTQVDFMTPLTNAVRTGITAFENFRQRQGEQQAAEINDEINKSLIGAVDEQPPEDAQTLATVAGEADNLQRRFSAMEAQGMSTTAVARRRQQAITDLIRRFPGYSDEIIKRANALNPLTNDLTKQADAELARETERQAAAMKVVTDEVTKFRGNTVGMSQEEIVSFYNENVAPRFLATSAAARRLEELSQQSDVIAAEQKLQAQRDEEAIRPVLYQTYTQDIKGLLENQDMDPQERVQRLRGAKANLEATLSRQVGVLGSQVTSIYGGLLSQFDAAITIAEDSLPQNANRKSQGELDAIKIQIQLNEARARLGLQQTNTNYAQLTVLNEDFSNLFRDVLPQWQRAGALQDNVANILTTLGPAIDAQNGDTIPPLMASRDGRSTPALDSQRGTATAGALNSAFMEAGQAITPQLQDTFGRVMVGIFQEQNYTTSKRGLQQIMPVLTNPRAAELMANSQFAPEVRAKGTQILQSYIVDVQQAAERRLGSFDGRVKVEVGTNGLIRLSPIDPNATVQQGAGRNRRSVPAVDTAELAKVQRELNNVIKVHAHINGDTDYAGSSRTLFGD